MITTVYILIISLFIYADYAKVSFLFETEFPTNYPPVIKIPSENVSGYLKFLVIWEPTDLTMYEDFYELPGFNLWIGY